MKKLLIVMMTVLLISALFISCSNEVEKDTLGKVSISFDEAKDISSSMASSIKPVSALKWYYTAVKTSGLYASGQKTELTKIEAGLVEGTSLGDFSTGNWEFSFYGFNADADKNTITKAIYSATEIPVTVSGSGTNKVNIVLSLNEQAVDNGQVKFENLSFDLTGWEDDILTGEKLTLKIYQGEVAAGNLKATFESATVGDKTSYPLTLSYGEASLSLDAGTYSFNFVVLYDGEEVASDSRSVNLSKGAVVTFYGDVHKTSSKNSVILGSISGEVDGLATSEVIQPSAVAEAFTVNADISPASISYVDAPAESAKTVVDFAEGSVEAADDATYKLVTNVTGVEKAATATGFVMSSEEDNTAFAAIDLTLFEVKNEEETEKSLSTNGSVTVTTYIAKGLSKVYVTYNGTNESNPLVTSDENDTGAAFTTGGKAHVYETAEGMGDNLGYAQDTGLLRFRTTHFSEFVVDAEQNVYDKTNNTAYKLTELTKRNTDKTHEYVLLDSTKSNEVPDAIDNFNAGYRWSAVHPAGENPNTEDFAGGYGTKLEPYLISNRNQFQNVSMYDWYGIALQRYYSGYSWSDSRAYANENAKNSYHGPINYWMISDGVEEIDCSNWSPISLYGCFNGNHVELINLDKVLFNRAYAYDPLLREYVACVLRDFTVDASIDISGAASAIAGSAGPVITFIDVDVHGSISGNYVGSYFTFGAGQFESDSSSNPTVAGVYTFIDCESDADLYCNSIGEGGAGGFIHHPYGATGTVVTIKDSKYTGTMYVFTDKKHNYVSCFDCTQVVFEYSQGYIPGKYTINSDSNENSYNFIYPEPGYVCVSGSKHGQLSNYDCISIDAVSSAVTARATLFIAPNPGALLYPAIVEILYLDDGKFTTDKVRKYDITWGGEVKDTITGNIYDVGGGSSYSGVNSSYIIINQYDGDGKLVSSDQYTVCGKLGN